ncbi:hypothetical protein KEM56_000664 [Ascosphaera pollenicola]|nr:hypothetical protein KEM56_000664 [Ascosphaera pollenicola]
MRSTSGNRAWTEAEEAYVLQARSHKTPYKKIAADLNKTELACRLHYHQMSYGRKKSWGGRNGSTSSSVASIDHSPEPAWGSPPMQHRQPSCISLQTQQPQFQVPILPKPRALSMAWPHFEAGARRKHSVMSLGGTDPSHCAYNVDCERIKQLYERHRSYFWTVIAAEYSEESEVSPDLLERTFFEEIRRPSVKFSVPQHPLPEMSPTQLPLRFHELSVSDVSPTLPPPPPPPPSSHKPVQHDCMPYRCERMPSLVSTNDSKSTTSTASSASSTNSSDHTKKCAVSSLLNVERDVWHSKEIKAL